MLEQLEILGRIAESGKKMSEDKYDPPLAEDFTDIFIHMLDEIERVEKLA